MLSIFQCSEKIANMTVYILEFVAFIDTIELIVVILQISINDEYRITYREGRQCPRVERQPIISFTTPGSASDTIDALFHMNII